MEPSEGSGRSLVKRHAFGIRPDVYGCLNWVEEGTLLYPVGKTVAMHNLNTNTQRFFEGGVHSSGLTALAVSENKKFIAIADGGALPQIQIIDSVPRKRRKTLTVPDLGSDRFVAMDFSVDGRHLATQGGAPLWKLFYWNWERSKPLAFTSIVADLPSQDNHHSGSHSSGLQESHTKDLHSSTSIAPPPVSCVTICPQDPLMIGVSGLGMMRFYRYADGVLQMQPSIDYELEQSSNFLTHAWVARDRVVASTQTGELLIIDRGVYKRLLPVPPSTKAQLNNPMVLSLVSSKGGFVAGSDQGTVAIYESMSDIDCDYAIAYNVPVPTEEEIHAKPEVDDSNAPVPSAVTAPSNPISSGSVTTTTPTASTLSPTTIAAAGGGGGGGCGGGGAGDGGTDEGSLQHSASRVSKPLFQMNVGAAQKTKAAPTEGTRSNPSIPEVSQINVRRETSVVRLALNNLEETIALVTYSGQILAFNFAEAWGKRSISDPPKLLPICQSFHVGGIVGVDCSVRRPFLVTSGVDKSVRIWNTTTHRLEMCQFFPTAPGPVSIHPNGLYVVVCFSDKVRIMSVLWNCLHEYQALNLRNVTDVKFSVGGKYFALAHGNLIHLYNSLTCDAYGQLRGHPQKINHFQWASTSPYPTDNGMVSCSLDGIIINWNISEMRKDGEHADKRYQYKGISADDKNLWAIGEPASALGDVQYKTMLREIDRFNSTESPNAPATVDYEFRDTGISTLLVAPKQRVMFAGMEDGSIKFMSFPLQVGIQEIPTVAHMGRVTRMALSYDESTIYSVSSDGTLFVIDVREDGRPVQRDTGYYGDEVLVLAADVENRQIAIESLTHTAGKLRTEIEGEEKRRSHEQNTRIRERADEFKNEVAALEAEYAALWNTKAEQERSFVAVKLEKEAEAAPVLEELERAGQAEVQRLEDECTELQYRLDGCKEKYAQEIRELQQRIERERLEDEERFNDVIAKRKEGVQKLKRQVQRAKEANVESRRRLELDTDAELEGIRSRNRRDLEAIRERYLRMKGESAIMRKNALRMEKESEVHTNELNILDSAKTALMTQLGELNQRMTHLHQDIEERDAVIGEKEKRIYDLKKQNQELEKHKFVLDYRIRQLKSQMEPRQREIAQEHQRINEKNIELEGLHQNNITLRQNIEELKSDLAQQQQQIKQSLKHMKDFETYKSRVKTDVGELAPAMQDPAKLREVVERLYQRHVVARDGHRAAQVDNEIKGEFNSQLEYLSTSVEALRRKCKADQEQHRCEVSAMMVENLALIREIHDLRAEIVGLRNASVAAADEAKRRARQEPAKKLNSSTPCVNATPSNALSTSSRRPEPPQELEENRAEIRKLRAFVDSAQQALMAATQTRPMPSVCTFPPI